jgi:hypothetical protein
MSGVVSVRGVNPSAPKAKAFVEPCCPLIDRMNDYGANSNLLRCPDHAHERVIEQRGADLLARQADIDRQARKDGNWDREIVGTPQPSGSRPRMDE